MKTAVYFATNRAPTRARGALLGSSTDVYAELADIANADREHFIVFDVNVRHRVIARRVVSVGFLCGVDVHPREVFKGAILNSAHAIILAHNHPSGDPTPSRQDIDLTARIREAGELLGISVLDHVIACADGFTSFASRSDW